MRHEVRSSGHPLPFPSPGRPMRFFRLIGLAPCSPLRLAPCIPPGPFSKLAHVEADPSVSSSPRGGRTRWEVSWAAQVPRWPGFQTHTELSPTSHTTPRGGRCWVRDEGEASQPEECSLPGASLTHGPATRSLLWGKGNEMDAGEEAASGSRLLPGLVHCPLWPWPSWPSAFGASWLCF